MGKKIEGAVLSDQVKSLDWKARNVKFIEKADNVILQDVMARLSVILDQGAGDFGRIFLGQSEGPH